MTSLSHVTILKVDVTRFVLTQHSGHEVDDLSRSHLLHGNGPGFRGLDRTALDLPGQIDQIAVKGLAKVHSLVAEHEQVPAEFGFAGRGVHFYGVGLDVDLGGQLRDHYRQILHQGRVKQSVEAFREAFVDEIFYEHPPYDVGVGDMLDFVYAS